MEYPRDLWKSYNDYPLAPEKIKIDNVEKLAGNFYPKFHYVLYIIEISNNISVLESDLKKFTEESHFINQDGRNHI